MSSQTLTYGLHAVASLINKSPARIIRLHLLQDRHDQKIQALIALANEKNIPLQFSSRQELDRLTASANHQGVLVFCHPAPKYTENDLEDLLENLQEKPFLLILDSVQDPHNLGACLRSADAAGVHAVIAPKDKSVGITPTVSKVASGAAENVPFIQVTNLVRTMKLLQEKNIWIFGASDAAEKTLYQEKFTVPTALALGAEGEGLRRLTKETCDVLIKIPMYGSVSSLNVSVAAGILLYEVVRQRFI